MWDRVKVTTKPVGDLIDLADLKARLRVDTSDDDTLLAALLKGAIARIDGPDGIGFAMLQQTWRLTLDAFPRGAIYLPGAPVKSVTSITYLDTDGVEQTLAAEDYRAVVDVDPALIEPVYGGAWPSTRAVAGAVKVNYVLGEAAADDVPGDLIDAVCLLVGHRYENREAVNVGNIVTEFPLGVQWLLAAYRRQAVV